MIRKGRKPTPQNEEERLQHKKEKAESKLRQAEHRNERKRAKRLLKLNIDPLSGHPSSLIKPYVPISIHDIKLVPLPSSWYWQDKCLEKDNQYICSNFKWLNNENSSFMYIKSILVDRNSIRYFVRGKHVVGQQLKTRFSTVSELATVVKTFDETPLCGGPILSETITLSHANATHKIPSKSCLQLTTGNQRYCRECSTLIESLKGKTTNNSSHYNAPKPGPANSTQSDAHSTGNRAGNISNAPPKITQVNLKYQSSFAASRPFSDITNQNEESGNSTSIADHSYHMTDNLEKSNNQTATETTIAEDHWGLSREQLDAVVDSKILLDREAVTLKSMCTVITTSNTCSKDLEQRLIKRPTLLKTSNYPLRLYNLHTWRYGVYSPLNPFTVSSEADDLCNLKTNIPPFVTIGTNQPEATYSCTVKQNIDIQSEEQFSQETLPMFHIPKMTYSCKNDTVYFDSNKYCGQQSRFTDAEKDHNVCQPVEDPPSEEEKNDLESALNLLKKQNRNKKLLQKRIRSLSKQLTT